MYIITDSLPAFAALHVHVLLIWAGQGVDAPHCTSTSTQRVARSLDINKYEDRHKINIFRLSLILNLNDAEDKKDCVCAVCGVR